MAKKVDDSTYKIDIESIEKELSVAVSTEAQRQAIDEMKKRAVHSASNYDEFKNLVACASQKPVSAKEMTELRESKADHTELSSVALDGPVTDVKRQQSNGRKRIGRKNRLAKRPE